MSGIVTFFLFLLKRYDVMTERLFVAFYSRLHYPYLSAGAAANCQKNKPDGGRDGNCIKGGSEETNSLHRLDLLFIGQRFFVDPGCQDPRMSYGNDDPKTKKTRAIISL